MRILLNLFHVSLNVKTVLAPGSEFFPPKCIQFTLAFKQSTQMIEIFSLDL